MMAGGSNRYHSRTPVPTVAFPVSGLLAAAALAWSCGRSPGAPAATLRFHNMAEPRTLDPAGATLVPEKNLLLALGEGLTSVAPGGSGPPAPGVAHAWETSGDGRTLTFHLRPCTWSNGEPITADDFRRSWLRVLEPVTASPLAGLLFGIQGARDFYAGLGSRDAVGVETPDPRTLVVRLEHPQPWFPEMAASSPFVPVHASADRVPGFFVRRDAFVGNGPFVLESRIPNDRIVLRKNSLYWDAANVTLERIVMFSTDSRQAALAAFAGKRTDWVDDFPSVQAAAWRGSPALRTSPYLATYFLRFNTRKPPFGDRRVREAFHCAIDREAICARILGLGQRPATSLVPRSIEGPTGYRPVEGPGFDPERARQLLTEAGYPGGRGLGPVAYQFDTSEDHRRIAEAIQAMLARHLGVSVTLVNKEKKAAIEDEERLLYGGLSRGSWIADYVDPASFLDVFESGSPANRTGFASAAYDALLTRARACADRAERLRVLAEAERLLVTREFPLTPIYEYVKQSLVDPDRLAGGFGGSLLGYHPMKWIRLRT